MRYICLSLFFLTAMNINGQWIKKYTLSEFDSICVTLSRKGQFLQLKNYANEFLLQAKNANDTLYRRSATCFLIDAERKLSNYEIAENYSYQLLELFSEQDKSTHYLGYVRGLLFLGGIYYELGRFNEAEVQFFEARNILKKYDNKGKNYGSVLNNLAAINLNKGNSEKAKEYMLESLAITKNSLGVKDKDYCLELSNLALVYESQGEIKKAEEYLLEALSVNNKYSKNNYLLRSRLLIEIGRLYSKNDATQKAKPFLKEAFDLLKEKLGVRNEHTMFAMVNLGIMEYYKEDYLGGLGYAKACFAINSNYSVDTSSLEMLLDKLPKTDVLSLNILSRNLELLEHLLIKLYDKTKNRHWLRCLYKTYLAWNAINNKHRYTFAFEEDKLNLVRKNALYAPKGIAAALELDCEECLWNAFLLAEENKSMLLAEALKSEGNNKFGKIPITLLQKEKKLQKKIIEIKKSLGESSAELLDKDSLRGVLSQMNKEVVQFRNEIKLTYPKYYEKEFLLNTLTLKQTQGLLQDNQALIEYLVAPKKTYIFLIRTKSIKVYQLDVDKKEIKTKVDRFRKMLIDTEEENTNNQETVRLFAHTGYWFYQNLLKPVLDDQDAHIDHLTIVPDGILGVLPFETFLTELPDTNTIISYEQLPYLLQDYQLNYSYSVTLLDENKKASNQLHNNNVLAYAASYADAGDSNLADKTRSKYLLDIRTQLTDIPEALLEVEMLKNKFEGTFRVKGKASESNFKKDIQNNFAVVHLAMHSIMDKEKPLLSALAFAETQDTLEDDFLQAYEISQLDLQTNLVVLSACETGVGKLEQGEGMMSLARSFMYAGTPSLVVSLWRINDLSTAVLMELFYKYLSRGENKARALQSAKKEYLAKVTGEASHPAYWAPFVQLGNSSPIFVQPKKTSNWKVIKMILGILFVLLFVLIIFKIQFFVKKRY